jgi:hypothetical protein
MQQEGHDRRRQNRLRGRTVAGAVDCGVCVKRDSLVCGTSIKT